MVLPGGQEVGGREDTGSGSWIFMFSLPSVLGMLTLGFPSTESCFRDQCGFMVLFSSLVSLRIGRELMCNGKEVNPSLGGRSLLLGGQGS